MSVFDDLNAFLAKDFPGSDIDDGYSFVRIEAPHSVLATRGQMQPIADDLCENGALLVIVGADPAPFVSGRVETRSVRYQSDFNVDDPKEMCGARVSGSVDITALANAISGPGTLVIAAPRTGLVLNVSLARVFGKKGALDALVAAHPQSFETA